MPTTTTTAFTPTSEQQRALELFGTGDDLVIQARAGAGKTSTLRLLASSTRRRGQYLAFNRSIAEEAKRTMPRNVSASTMHSLAFRAYGRNFRHRLDSRRMRAHELAAHMGLDPFVVTYGENRKTLSAGFLAGHVMKAVERFCQSADDEPGRRHVAYIDGIDLPNEDGTRTYGNNDAVADHVLEAVAAAWDDLNRPDGVLPFGHHVYLKAWQLTRPQLPTDFLLVDEAQDVAPVMYAIVSNQQRAQLIAVGDDAQEIYSFTGAINAMDRMQAEQRTTLSQSFRFGPEIADVANRVLAMLGTEPLRGTTSIQSSVETLEYPDAILTRTNATAVTLVMQALLERRRPHLLGGGREVVSFARAAKELQRGIRTEHRDLACFESWGEVQEYVEQDAQGEDLRLLVDLVDTFGVQSILDALDNMAPEQACDVVISTAHKAKGREWPRVRLAEDFTRWREGRVVRPEPEELRLLYVAATRAQRVLDIDAVAALSVAELPERACPFCQRADVIRPGGSIGPHSCAADDLPGLYLEGIDG